MRKVLNMELKYTALKQLLTTALAISIGQLLLTYLPLGFNDLMEGYFRTLCVGYGIYAVANTMLLILLYFTDYQGGLVASALFALFLRVDVPEFLRQFHWQCAVRPLPSFHRYRSVLFHSGSGRNVQPHFRVYNISARDSSLKRVT